ncbi:MAG: phospholipase C/P1 nuclease family protein [Candidatus Acidiferrales bacterium]
MMGNAKGTTNFAWLPPGRQKQRLCFQTRAFTHTGIAMLMMASIVFAPPAFGWGENADRLVVNNAVGTLPPEMRPFFEANRQFLVLYVTDPTEAAAKSPMEMDNQYIRLDHYGAYPFTNLPRVYKDAARKFSKRSLDANGLLPWEVGLYSAKLTDDFHSRNLAAAKLDAALLAHYVSMAHDPFNTTMNDDGRLSGQPGVNDRFGKKLVNRYALFFYLHPNPASFVTDPTDRAFEICLTAHSLLEGVLLADRRSREGLQDYNDDYYDRFYSQAGAVLVRQISDAATDVGSYWLTAWENAGRPPLPAQ